MTRISEVLQAKGLSQPQAASEASANPRAKQPSHPTGEESGGTATTLAPPARAAVIAGETAGTKPRRGSAARVSAEDRDAIQRYLGDFAPELGDQAPFKSSVSRVCNIYVESGLTLAAFIQRLYAARSRTKERYTSIRDRSKRFAYYCALLEEECGLREPPPEIAAAAKAQAEQGLSQAETHQPGRSESLAGRYANIVHHGRD
jgi:hypothetical protein